MTDPRIEPVTPEGERFAGLADIHARGFAPAAAENDAPGRFAHEHVAAMQESGFMSGAVPAELGGIGVTHVRDLAAGISRLAEGDASTTIGVAMHFLVSWMMARSWRAARDSGQDPDGTLLKRIVRGEEVLAVLNSEAGTDNRHPFAEARPVEGGWHITGRKAFGTFSPAATLFTTRIRVPLDDGGWGLASASIPASAEGVIPQDNWDAMGMRASGSQDIVLEDVFVPPDAVSRPVPWGQIGPPGHIGGMAAGVCLASPFLGIAEAAHRESLALVQKRKRQPHETPLAGWAPVQLEVASNEVELLSMRGALARAADHIDAIYAAAWPKNPGETELHRGMKEAQAAKITVNQGAIRVVDRCLAISGGSGYHARSPLSRYYRDVRAGPFMSPFGALEAPEYIGRAALGLPPEG